MDITVESIENNVRVVDSNRNYWFIRTYGGIMYDEFIDKGFVGIGFNHIPYGIIKSAKPKSKLFSDSFGKIHEYLIGDGYSKAQATGWANQLVGFEHDVKEGDMVIIPNENSAKFSLGIVRTKTKIVQKPGKFSFRDTFEEYPQKRKNVEWVKTVYRNSLPDEISKMTSTHRAISWAGEYKDYLEGSISNLYIREDEIYLQIKIGKDEDINAFDLQRFLSSMTYLYSEFCKDAGIVDYEDLAIKIKLQSKGRMALKAAIYTGMLGIAGILILSDNVKVDLDLRALKLKGTSDGFMQTLTNFMNEKQKREMEYEIFQDSLRRLNQTTVNDSKDENPVTD